MKIVSVSAKEYWEFIESSPIVVIHFWADWNRYDDQMRERLAAVNPVYERIVSVGAFDTTPEEGWNICRQVGIVNLPALVYYRNGDHVRTEMGLKPIKEIEANLD